MQTQLQIQPKQQAMVNTFLLFFIIHASQVGIGVQSFQREIFKVAKQDAWISVILSGILIHFVIFVIIKTLQLYESSDIYAIQHDVYGKWLGGLFNSIYVLHCLSMFIIVILNYTEVIQTWMFPFLPTWLISISILLLVFYGVTGGFQVIVGVCFFSIVLSVWLIGLVGFPLRFADYHHLLPFMEASTQSIVKGAFKMTLTFLGFEIIYVVYPFLKEKEKVQKFAHLGHGFTILFYLVVMLISIIYFSSEQLKNTIWPTLSLFKIVKLPFIERMEYVVIAFWLLIVLPNLILYMWGPVRYARRIFGKKAKILQWIFGFCVFIASLVINTRTKVNSFNQFFDQVTIYYVYIYPFFLFGLAVLKKKMKSFKEKANGD